MQKFTGDLNDPFKAVLRFQCRNKDSLLLCCPCFLCPSHLSSPVPVSLSGESLEENIDGNDSQVSLWGASVNLLSLLFVSLVTAAVQTWVHLSSVTVKDSPVCRWELALFLVFRKPSLSLFVQKSCLSRKVWVWDLLRCVRCVCEQHWLVAEQREPRSSVGFYICCVVSNSCSVTGGCSVDFARLVCGASAASQVLKL